MCMGHGDRGGALTERVPWDTMRGAAPGQRGGASVDEGDSAAGRRSTRETARARVGTADGGRGKVGDGCRACRLDFVDVNRAR